MQVTEGCSWLQLLLDVVVVALPVDLDYYVGIKDNINLSLYYGCLFFVVYL